MPCGIVDDERRRRRRRRAAPRRARAPAPRCPAASGISCSTGDQAAAVRRREEQRGLDARHGRRRRGARRRLCRRVRGFRRGVGCRRMRDSPVISAQPRATAATPIATTAMTRWRFIAVGAAGPRLRRRALDVRAELHDGVEQRLRDLILIGARRQRLFLIGVRQVADLDEHGRHVRADEHAERRLLHGARRHRRRACAAPARRCRRAPTTARDTAPAPSPTRIRSIARVPPPSVGNCASDDSASAARFGVGAIDAEVVDLGALHRRPDARRWREC